MKILKSGTKCRVGYKAAFPRVVKCRIELRQKPVVVIAENGLEMTAKPKLGLEDPFDFENIKNIVITYE
jgi:hypothetical protein